MLTIYKLIIIIGIVFVVITGVAAAGDVLFREDFDSLDQWRPLEFPKIKQHTKYSISRDDDGSYLQAESSASASGIVFKREFNVYEFPKVRWRWRISNVYKKGNAREKSGDDYPLRIYIVFKYDPDRASFGKKIKYGLVRRIYGEYPPDSSLNYIWANRDQGQDILINTYADEARMIVLQAGDANAGQWIEQAINIVDDYHSAFGEDPPAIASLAIMSDSDNTGESATSYVDYIEVSK